MSLLGSSQMASPDAEKADSAAESARVLVEAIRNEPQAARHHHAQVDRERDRAGHGDRRLDQRGAALPGDRRGGRGEVDDRRLRARARARCRCCATSSPRARYVATDFHRAGGMPQVLKMLLEHGLLHGDCMTITGRTLAEKLKDVPDAAARGPGRDPAVGQADVRAGPPRDPQGQPRARRLRRQDHRAEEPVDHRPGARVRLRAASAWRRSWRSKIKAGDVVVIRYEGPKGGPGHAGDARADLGADRPGPGRIGRPHHRRPLLRRHLGHGRRPRRAGGVRRRHRSRW